MSPTDPAKVKQFLQPYAHDIALFLFPFSSPSFPLSFVPFVVLDIAGRTCVAQPANFRQFVVIRTVYDEENQSEIRDARSYRWTIGFADPRRLLAQFIRSSG